MPIPSLGSYLSLLRKREERRRLADGRLTHPNKLSRERLSREVAVSARTIEKIETGEVKQPTLAVLAALVTPLGLSRDEFWHLCDLADYSENYGLGLFALQMSVPDLEQSMRAADAMPLLKADLEGDHPTELVAVFDPLWRLVDANKTYRTLLPRHDIGSIPLEWYLSAEGRKTVLEWRQELAIIIPWWRCLVGRYRNDHEVITRHRSMWRHPEYRELWELGEVCYGRPTEHSSIRLRDPLTGITRTLLNEWSVITSSSVPLVRFRGRVVAHTGP
ncbi:helix-turn-helix domain-containing protein [Nocardia sp. CA-107356]|uniref:helix-turn-helix domain-containing protein n=1 Tax=Nocardia sp. CA-107356 TaxID=3239972 RepID=UPI003D92BCE2